MRIVSDSEAPAGRLHSVMTSKQLHYDGIRLFIMRSTGSVRGRIIQINAEPANSSSPAVVPVARTKEIALPAIIFVIISAMRAVIIILINDTHHYHCY